MKDNEFSLKLHFPTSRSKNFATVAKLAGHFEKFEAGEMNVVTVLLKEIFEKWDSFNLLFWGTVDWKGSVLELDGMKWHSHCEKTRLFYHIQEAKTAYICFIEQKYIHLDKVHRNMISYNELHDRIYTDDEMNYLIEKFKIETIKKNIKDDGLDEHIKIPNSPYRWGISKINLKLDGK